MSRLSSDYLYHFTRKSDAIEKILQYGFRHSLSNEKISFANVLQQNFIACFCDIKFSEISAHRECYGDYAICLKKEWGINNGVTPVTYIHETSPIFSEKSKRLKNKNRFIFENFDHRKNKSLLKIIKRYLRLSLLEERSGEKINNPEQALRNKGMRDQYNDIDKELSLFVENLQKYDLDKKFIEYIYAIGKNILELNDQLENRDWLARSYFDEFSCPNQGKRIKKVLYDEREWRSVQDASWLKVDYGPEKYNEAIHKGFLPEKYNLRFKDDDIIGIILPSQKEVDNLIEMSSSDKFLVSHKKIKSITVTPENFNKI